MAAARRTGLLGAIAAVLACCAAVAQQPQDHPAANPPAEAPAPATTEGPPVAPAAPEEPGPLGAVGNFIGKSFSDVTLGLKATGKAIDDATAPARDAAKDAAAAAAGVVRLPKAGFASGAEQCPAAPNGAPDCRAAADALCRGKGYETGRSLDTQTRTCLPQNAGVGAPPKLGDCVFVTRAWCQ